MFFTTKDEDWDSSRLPHLLACLSYCPGSSVSQGLSGSPGCPPCPAHGRCLMTIYEYVNKCTVCGWENGPIPVCQWWLWEITSQSYSLQKQRIRLREPSGGRFCRFLWKVKGFPWWLRGQRICLQCGRSGFNPWVGKIPWRRAWWPTPVLLPGESHGRRSLVGYSPWGPKEWDTTEWLSTHGHSHKPRNTKGGQQSPEAWRESQSRFPLRASRSN